MGTLIKKLTSDSAYLWLKTLKMEFIFQGSQKKHVRVAISQKGLYEMSQDAPHFIAFWTPD